MSDYEYTDPDRVLAEAAHAGMATEALSQVLTTCSTLVMFALEGPETFAQWRAYCDGKGWASGPRSKEIMRVTGQFLAKMQDELL